MKKSVALCFFLFSFAAYGQIKSEIIALKIGFGTTAIGIKEANSPAVNLFGFPFDSGNTFAGDGIEFGLTKKLNSKIFIDLAFASFSGGERRLKVNSYEYFYKLKGFQIPLTANYLIRKEERKFRFPLSLGLQYLHASLNTKDKYIDQNNNLAEHQRPEINISEGSIIFGGGLEYRIIPDLFASFTVKAAVSTSGRYSDRPSLSLRYSFSRNQRN